MKMAYPERHRHQHLLRFLALSLGLHIAVLVPVYTSFHLGGYKHAVLAVRLEPPSSTHASARHPEHIRGSRQRKQSFTLRSGKHTVLPSTSTDVANLPENTGRDGQARQQPLPDDSTNPVAPSSGAGHKNMAQARIQAYLMTNMARFFSYPMIARLRGWEGKVLLGFNVSADGYIGNVHISRSSGYAILDHSAVNSLANINHIRPARRWLNGKTVNLQLPVIYRLESR